MQIMLLEQELPSLKGWLNFFTLNCLKRIGSGKFQVFKARGKIMGNALGSSIPEYWTFWGVSCGLCHCLFDHRVVSLLEVDGCHVQQELKNHGNSFAILNRKHKNILKSLSITDSPFITSKHFTFSSVNTVIIGHNSFLTFLYFFFSSLVGWYSSHRKILIP